MPGHLFVALSPWLKMPVNRSPGGIWFSSLLFVADFPLTGVGVGKAGWLPVPGTCCGLVCSSAAGERWCNTGVKTQSSHDGSTVHSAEVLARMVADLAAVYHYLVERLWDQSEHRTRMSEYLVAKAGSCTGEEATGKLLKQRSTERKTQMSKKWLLLKKNYVCKPN